MGCYPHKDYRTFDFEKLHKIKIPRLTSSFCNQRNYTKHLNFLDIIKELPVEFEDSIA